jgi:hypothetical protein
MFANPSPASSVVHAFLRGESPEGIAESFPALELEQIFGALTFYMANRDLVDRYLSEGRREFEALRQEARRNNSSLCMKLAEARRRSQMPGARGCVSASVTPLLGPPLTKP